MSVQNTDYQERRLQIRYDTGLFLQAKQVPRTYENPRNELVDSATRGVWTAMSKLDNPNIKFSIRAWNDSTLLMRVHNLHDTETAKITLFASNTSVFLTSFYGM